MMKAVVLEEFGSAPVLRTVEHPTAAPGEVVVRVEASGVNPLDVKIAAGSAGHARVTPPMVLGMDLAGVVTELGEGVRGFQVGDEVYGLTGGVGRSPGSLAEYSAVDADLLAVKPARLSMAEAAALPLASVTAWEGLVDRAATVEDYVASVTGGEGFDVIFDTVGGAALDGAFAAVRTYTGHVVSILGWGTHSLAPLSFRGATYSGVFTLLPILTGNGRARHGEILRSVASLVDAGKITPVLDPQPYRLADVAEATPQGGRRDRPRQGRGADRLGLGGPRAVDREVTPQADGSPQRDERDPAVPALAALWSGHGQGGGERQGSRR